MTPYQRRQYYKDYERELNRAENYAYRRFKSLLSKQITTVIANVKARGVIATEADISNIITDQTLRTAFIDVFIRTGQQFKDFLTPRLPKTKNVSSLITGFFSDYFTRQMQDYALQVAGVHITSITETTRKQIKEVLAEAADNRLSIRETARLINQRLGGQVLKSRALLIARTETTAAANHGQYLTAKDSGIELQKEWIATNDGRTRDSHRAMNGKLADIDAKFSVNGKAMMYPGDSAGGASEVVNCRCTCAFVPKMTELAPVYAPKPRPSLVSELIGAALVELLVEGNS